MIILANLAARAADRGLRRCSGAALGALLCCSVAPSTDAAVPAKDATPPALADPLLRMPSPDWRDQIIYFVMIDRFDDGNPDNDDQGGAEFDPADGAKFSGGDLAGIARRVDYIKTLGATAVWITPPVANRWWDESTRYGGYHGYWAENFMQVDRHFGTLADYQQLSRRLHRSGMYLVQDIVLNHTANYFHYGDDWNKDDPARGYVANPDAQGRRAPSQAPFDRNDPRDPQQAQQAIYHWTPAIRDFGDSDQLLNRQLADLDDLNTENPLVRAALRRSYAWWIEQAGVDAFRVDTAFYVPPDFLRDFLHSDDALAPGILHVAQRSGRRQFHLFGEGFGVEQAYSDNLAEKIDTYMHSAPGLPAALPAMINFPLYGASADVFARGRPTAELAYRIRRMMQIHQQPWLMPSFVDNHDVERFLASGSNAALKQALLLIMTLPGIPTIYYGTEQGFTGQRASMFAGGFGAAGRDHFDPRSDLYRYLQRAIGLRRQQHVLSRGTPTILRDSAAAAGGLVYSMSDGDSRLMVAFNSADHAVLLDNVDSGLPAGTQLRGLFGIDGTAPDIAAGADGRISLSLPARAGWVWKVAGKAALAGTSAARLALDALPSESRTGDFALGGTARAIDRLQVVVDGRLDAATNIVPDADGRFSTRIDTQSMIDPAIEHRVVAWAAGPGMASPAQAFRVAREWTTVAELADPDGDDHGPQGRYEYPLDPGWRDHRQLDIRRIRVETSGAALRVALDMREVGALWSAPHGFDHVLFNLFIQLPGRSDGSSRMPLQNAELPEGMRWNFRLRAGGWTNALFSSAGASAQSEGTAVVPAADIRVDADRHTVSFALPAAALGHPDSWSGARIYLNTWDYDGGYRELAAQAKDAAFGGGDAAHDALIMDETAVITLP